MTHAELIKRAARWLRQKGNAVIITEMTSGAAESPDAIGFRNGIGTLIECKASRSDFLADGRKHFRRMPIHAMGVMRYYLTPPGIINATDPINGWGHIEVNGRIAKIERESQMFTDSDRRYEVELLCSALRRTVFSIGEHPRGVRCKLYQIDGEGEPRATITATKETAL